MGRTFTIRVQNTNTQHINWRTFVIVAGITLFVMGQQNNKAAWKTNKPLKYGEAHASSTSSISALQVVKCLSFSLIRWPQQGAPHQQPADGELGLGLWRIYDFIWHIDSKLICIGLHTSGAVGIGFVM